MLILGKISGHGGNPLTGRRARGVAAASLLALDWARFFANTATQMQQLREKAPFAAKDVRFRDD
jgi:hypothetical protein